MNTDTSKDTFSLDDLLAAPIFPFTATINLGGGRKLTLTYRPSSESAKEAVKAHLVEAFAALGFDGKVALRNVYGHAPQGEESEQFLAAYHALGDGADETLQAVLDHAEGMATALLVGSWNLTDPVTAETCARLPKEVRGAIVRLADSAELPVERSAFLGSSPRA